MDITKSQLKYIMAIRFLEGEDISQSRICDFMGVKGSSASAALKKLCEAGYIERVEYDSGCEYKLTENSEIILNLIDKERFEFFSLFYEKLSISYELCEKEYNKVCGMFGEEFVEKLAEARGKGYEIKGKLNEKTGRFNLDQGVYELPFKVVHEESGGPSMGNKGFVHPAKLIIDGENDRILLEAREIYYKSKNSQILKGKLSTLYYFDFDGRWTRARIEHENIWVIPKQNLHYRVDKLGRPVFAVIKIKASATNKKMPVSVAEITFNLEGLKTLLQG